MCYINTYYFGLLLLSVHYISLYSCCAPLLHISFYIYVLFLVLVCETYLASNQILILLTDVSRSLAVINKQKSDVVNIAVFVSRYVKVHLIPLDAGRACAFYCCTVLEPQSQMSFSEGFCISVPANIPTVCPAAVRLLAGTSGSGGTAGGPSRDSY